MNKMINVVIGSVMVIIFVLFLFYYSGNKKEEGIEIYKNNSYESENEYNSESNILRYNNGEYVQEVEMIDLTNKLVYDNRTKVVYMKAVTYGGCFIYTEYLSENFKHYKYDKETATLIEQNE